MLIALLVIRGSKVIAALELALSLEQVVSTTNAQSGGVRQYVGADRASSCWNASFRRAYLRALC
jgi:hypothetical protein